MSEPSANPMRRALRALTHGVYVLSVRENEIDQFLIVSLVMQCSVEPPRIAIAITPNARIIEGFRNAEGGVLSVLDKTQLAAVRRYGAPGGVKHVPAMAERTSGGHPIPAEASYWIALGIRSETIAGDHVLFVANVIEAGVTHTSGEFGALVLSDSTFPYAG